MKSELLSLLPPLDQMQTDDERFMREAIKEALKAFERGEVPIGAIVVKEGRIISRGYNQVELLHDATAHAEMLAITSAESVLENWRLSKTTIYSTIEPCAMCAGAMFLSRVQRLVWGAPDIRVGANGSWVDLFSQNHPIHTVEVEKFILQQWCQAPMKLFFQQRRGEQKVESDAK